MKCLLPLGIVFNVGQKTRFPNMTQCWGLQWTCSQVVELAYKLEAVFEKESSSLSSFMIEMTF